MAAASQPSGRRREYHEQDLAHGLYDQIVTQRMQALLDRLRDAGVKVATRSVTGGDGRLLARECMAAVVGAIDQAISDEDPLTHDQLATVNEVLRQLRGAFGVEPSGIPSDDSRALLPLVLHAIGDQPISKFAPPDLSEHGLITGREGSDCLLVQLKREMAAADRIDWLVSFIKLSAVKLLEADIDGFLATGGTLRVITTAYMGATDPEALEALAALSRKHERRLTIRFSRESGATRLHAKAYIHQRDSAFGSAYIGSANLSRPALTDGLEWTVRIAQAASPGMWSKINATFDEWWGDSDFVEYGIDPDHPSHEQFRELVARERGEGARGGAEDQTSLPIFDLQPKTFQQAMLDRIAAERATLQRTRHLVVAATGTGKTMVAAFDFKAFRSRAIASGANAPRLLYLAHSERILSQARITFAQVLRDLNFGGMLVGGRDDRPCDALFASIQSWTSRIGTTTVAADHFHYVVVDEVHHGEAKSWKSILEWIRPQSLLGLTATPERADGLDIRRHFGNHITAELRLPEAIARRLLVPFRYFGVTDSIDLRSVGWSRGRYNAGGVEQAYLSAGAAWIDQVRQAIHRYIANPMHMRAIAFCSGVEHARAMHDSFVDLRQQAEARNERSLSSEFLDGRTPAEVREQAVERMRRGETQILFVADLFNEGVDIPEVDVVLFLRPTESLTVYLQQLGRGLRLSPGTNKDCLTVLDFVGNHRQEYDFTQRLQSLMVDASVSLKGQVSHGFSTLPPGCSIVFERIARERVLEHITSTIRSLRQQMIESVREARDYLDREPSFAEYVDISRVDPRSFYRKPDWRMTWHAIHAEAMAAPVRPTLESVSPYIAGLRAIASLSDPQLMDAGLRLLDLIEASAQIEPSVLDDRRLHVLLIELASGASSAIGTDAPPNASTVVAALTACPPLRSELRSLLEARRAAVTPLSLPSDLPGDVPLRIHHPYSVKQIRAAFGVSAAWAVTHQSGVDWIEEYRAHPMFVTLDKSAESFTERTRYRDYAISPTRFHWQSQSGSHRDNKTGRRIVNAMMPERESERTSMWLFLRHRQNDEFGTAPYVFMGAFRPISISGSRPLSVVGELPNPLPAEWYEIASRAR